MASDYNASVYSVDALFNLFFEVPVYQRGYAWGPEQVEDLFWDVFHHAYADESTHLLGEIITAPREDGVRVLIDGQQRVTTLWLFQAALRSRLRGLGEQPEALEQALRAVFDDARGIERPTLRLLTPFNGGDAVLQEILELSTGVEVHRPKSAPATQFNMANAFNTLVDLLGEHCPSIEDLRRMAGCLRKKVMVVELTAASADQALLLFETTNNRGLPLTASDLVKNFIFSKANEVQYVQISEYWSVMAKELKEAKIDISSFLRYVALGRYSKRLRDTELSTWFTGHRTDSAAAAEIAKDPVAFAQLLARWSACVRNMRAGLTSGGSVSKAFAELKLLGVKQSLPVLLTTVDWGDDAAEVVAQELTDFFFVSAVVRLRGQDVERLLTHWVSVLSTVGETAGHKPTATAVRAALRDVEDGELPRAQAALHADSFTATLGELRYNGRKSEIEKIRFFLRHAAAWLAEEDRWNGLAATTGLAIEHVLPQTITAEVKEEFGSDVTEADIHGLGNLCLLENPHNSKASNELFSVKVSTYTGSGVLQARSVTVMDAAGLPSKLRERLTVITDLAPGLDKSGNWNREAQARRLAAYQAVARRIWFSAR